MSLHSGTIWNTLSIIFRRRPPKPWAIDMERNSSGEDEAAAVDINPSVSGPGSAAQQTSKNHSICPDGATKPGVSKRLGPDEQAPNDSHPQNREPKLTEGDTFWNVYLEEAGKYDKEIIDQWSQDLDSLLTFVRFFLRSIEISAYNIDQKAALFSGILSVRRVLIVR